MADYAVRLLSDEKLAEQMREACLRRACQDFSKDIITDQYESIYYRVLDPQISGVVR
ncbi:hypothetical protein D3C73_1581910 [compost metagenome]